MKLIITTKDSHIKQEVMGIFEQVLIDTDDKVFIADNFINNIEIHHTYITINFETRKYIYSGITQYGINRAMIESFEVIT